MNLLNNATPWLADAIPFVDDSGRDGRLVVAKIQYAIDAAGQLHPVAVSDRLVYEDRFDDIDGDASKAPLLRPADVMAPQPATNVLLLGHAYAPEAEGVRRFEPWLGVAGAVFPLRVHGPRQWRQRSWPARLLTLFLRRRIKLVATGRVRSLPLSWRHAYGGIAALVGQPPVPWQLNPAGAGYHQDGRARAVDGVALPAIEDPREPIRHWHDRRVPHLPGAVSPQWAPRVAHGGTRDAAWQALRAPAMPADGSARYHNTAHPGLQFTPHLIGGEPFHAEGFCRSGEALVFHLPAHSLTAHSHHYGSFEPHRMPLNTVILEPDARKLTLLYRCFVPLMAGGFELRRIALGSDAHPALLRP
ncbi:DUF2169 domain-containing protein [soil metagenome]